MVPGKAATVPIVRVHTSSINWGTCAVRSWARLDYSTQFQENRYVSIQLEHDPATLQGGLIDAESTTCTGVEQ